MVNVNETQVKLIADSISEISVKKEHLDREFLKCKSQLETKLVTYFICSIICHQTHELINVDLNLIGWQYIEKVFTDLMKKGDTLLSIDYLHCEPVENIAMNLEMLFPKWENCDTTALNNSLNRATLLKKSAVSLKLSNINSVEDFIEKHLIDSQINVSSIYESLSKLDAFSDPYKKKSTLFLKLVSQSGLYELDRYDNIDPMMDYHMQRLLLRTGCVNIYNSTLSNKLRKQQPIDSDEEVRKNCIEAIKLIAHRSHHTIFDLDDIFWSIGRSCCKDKLLCVDYQCNKSPCTFVVLTNVKSHKKCIFDRVCFGKEKKIYREYWEPKVITDFY